MGSFFTKDWFPLNIIITLVLGGIGVLIWGLVTHWGHPPKHRGACAKGTSRCGPKGDCIDDSKYACVNGEQCDIDQATTGKNKKCCGRDGNKPMRSDDGLTCVSCYGPKSQDCNKKEYPSNTCCAKDEECCGEGKGTFNGQCCKNSGPASSHQECTKNDGEGVKCCPSSQVWMDQGHKRCCDGQVVTNTNGPNICCTDKEFICNKSANDKKTKVCCSEPCCEQGGICCPRQEESSSLLTADEKSSCVVAPGAPRSSGKCSEVCGNVFCNSSDTCIDLMDDNHTGIPGQCSEKSPGPSGKHSRCTFSTNAKYPSSKCLYGGKCEPIGVCDKAPWKICNGAPSSCPPGDGKCVNYNYPNNQDLVTNFCVPSDTTGCHWDDTDKVCPCGICATGQYKEISKTCKDDGECKGYVYVDQNTQTNTPCNWYKCIQHMSQVNNVWHIDWNAGTKKGTKHGSFNACIGHIDCPSCANSPAGCPENSGLSDENSNENSNGDDLQCCSPTPNDKCYESWLGHCPYPFDQNPQ
jgi:hypothetical protein